MATAMSFTKAPRAGGDRGPLFRRQVQERKVFKHAANEEVPVYGVRRRGAESGWEDYKAVGREPLEVVGGETQ
jgi:hypothetical protein